MFRTSHQTTVARFNIQKIPKLQSQPDPKDVLPILDTVIDTIISEYKQAKGLHEIDLSWGNTINIECYSFGFRQDDTVLVLPLVKETVQNDYLNMLSDIDFGHLLGTVSPAVKSELFDAVVKCCNVNVDKFLSMCFDEMDVHGHKLTTLSSLGKPSIPDWVITLANKRMTDLLNNLLLDMLTITDEMVIKCMNTILAKANVSRQSSVTIPIFTPLSPRKHATSLPTPSMILPNEMTSDIVFELPGCDTHGNGYGNGYNDQPVNGSGNGSGNTPDSTHVNPHSCVSEVHFRPGGIEKADISLAFSLNSFDSRIEDDDPPDRETDSDANDETCEDST